MVFVDSNKNEEYLFILYLSIFRFMLLNMTPLHLRGNSFAPQHYSTGSYSYLFVGIVINILHTYDTLLKYNKPATAVKDTYI